MCLQLQLELFVLYKYKMKWAAEVKLTQQKRAMSVETQISSTKKSKGKSILED